MWELQPIDNDTYNCFQYVTATVANEFRCDYRLMMLELWGFRYDYGKGGKIGEKLNMCWSGKREFRKTLLRYHGITFGILSQNTEDLMDFVKNNICNYPMALLIDSYVCPWLPYYRKQHLPHAIFIIDLKDNELWIHDQYITKQEKRTVNIETIIHQVSELVYFQKIPQGEARLVYQLLTDKLKEWETKGFYEFGTFRKDLVQLSDISIEITDDPLSSKLVMQMKNLADDHTNLIEAVELLEEIFGLDFSSIKNNLQRIALIYMKLRAYIIKCTFGKRNCKAQILDDELESILKMEIEIYNDLKTFVDCRTK